MGLRQPRFPNQQAGHFHAAALSPRVSAEQRGGQSATVDSIRETGWYGSGKGIKQFRGTDRIKSRRTAINFFLVTRAAMLFQLSTVFTKTFELPRVPGASSRCSLSLSPLSERKERGIDLCKYSNKNDFPLNCYNRCWSERLQLSIKFAACNRTIHTCNNSCSSYLLAGMYLRRNFIRGTLVFSNELETGVEENVPLMVVILRDARLFWSAL